ncbi:MAG: BamA/TamA family outer membrane protein [Fibrobacterales bacterium]
MKQFITLVLIAATTLFATPEACPTESEGVAIDSITFSGIETTLPKVIQRELTHTTNTPFQCSLYTKEKQRLMNLDIFSSVIASIDTVAEKNILTYTFKELPAYIIVPTIGKTDQDGWRAGAILASLNFLGNDIRLEAFARYGFRPSFASVQEYMLVVSSPYFMDLPIEYQIAYIKTERYNSIIDFNENSHLFQGEFSFPLVSNLDILWGGRSYYMISDRADIMSSGSLHETANRLHLGLSHDTRNARFNPFEGHYAEARISQTGIIAGGDIRYTEYLMDVRKYFHPSPHHLFRVYGLGEYRDGTFSQYEYFRSGGANVLAGYDNKAFSGTSELLLTTEYAYEFFHHKNFTVLGVNFFLGLQAVAGIDYGLFFNDGEKNHGYSYYTGVHLLVPGAERLRFEFSQNITHLSVDFNTGFFEKSTTRRWHIR